MKNRVRERELLIPALRAALKRPNGRIATSDLIEDLEGDVRPQGEDNHILEGRRDTKFSQKVRNLVSHRDASTSMFKRGLAVYTGDGIEITEAGRRYLNQVSH